MFSFGTKSGPRVVVTGIGHYHPETILDNSFFNSLDIDSSAEWILERTGIKSRHSILTKDEIIRLRRGETTIAELRKAGVIMTMAAMARQPWQMSLERSKLSERKVQIDTVISGTSVPDWDIPANACAIAAGLGLECTAYDINSACSTFVVNLHNARSLLRTEAAKAIAIVNAERYTTRLDFKDRKSCILFGDGATAAIVEYDAHAPGLEVIDTLVHSSPSGFNQIRIPEGGYFDQNGAAVQKFAVQKTMDITTEMLERNELKTKDISYFIGHQANLRMLTYAAEHLGIPPQRHLYNVDIRGNQGAAGAPAVLSTNWERFKRGDLIVMPVVGSGLTWACALFRVT